MDNSLELEEKNKNRAVVGFDLPNDANDADSTVLVMSESNENSKNRHSSLKRTLSKSMRGNLRSLSIHHLRNVQVEELAADIIQDIVGGDDLDETDSTNKSSAYQQFKYLESKSEIKCLTRPMKDKRRIMNLLENYENNQPTLQSQSLSLKSRISWHLFWHKASESNGHFTLRPWFKSIESRLGTGGSFFFRFVMSILIIDLFVLFFSFVFLALPQISYKWNTTVVDKLTDPPAYHNNRTFSGWEVILGDGWMIDTEMYYGHYTNLTAEMYLLSYNLKMAYFLVTCIILFCILLSLSIMFSRAFRYSYYSTKGGVNHVDANLIFSAWDFNTKEEKMASLCSNNIFLDLKILAAELKRKKQILGWVDKMREFITRMSVEIFITGLLLASPIAIYFACIKSEEDHSSLGFKLGIPVLLTSFNCFLPKLISELGKFEKWRSSRTSSYLAVVRTSTLQASNLGVLVYYWFSRLACSTDEVKCTSIKCWETFVGSQLYTLVILNLLFDVAIAGVHLLKRCLSRALISKVNPKYLVLLQALEFDVGRMSVDVIYVQCLLWLSVYFSPLLSFVIFLKLLVTFCLKKLTALLGCYEPVKVWRLGHLETLIRLIHLITFILCLSAFVYTVVYVTPSKDCGPFKSYKQPYEVFELSVFTNSSSDKDSFGIIVRDVFSSVGFRAFVCFIFGILVNYMKVHAQGRLGLAYQLKRQIELEGKDRCYYLGALNLLRSHLRHGKPGELVEAAKRKRPGINYFVEGSYEKIKQHQMARSAAPLTPCTAPTYWPPESRHLVTCDVYNVMFPSKMASSHQLDRESPSGHGGSRTQPSPDLKSLPDEVDRLFDFEKEIVDGNSNGGDN